MIYKLKIAFFASLVFLAGGPAFAAEFLVPAKDGDPNVIVSASETRHNLYSAGANVTVNGQITGDLFAAGGMVNLIGDVEADANVMGGSLSFNGKIGGDARVAGGNITVFGPIGGDLIIAGGNISITEKSSIGGDLVIGGGNIILEAPVKGSIKAGAGNITINSRVEGDVQIHSSGGKRNEGVVVFGPKAEVLGKISHKGTKEAIVKDGAKVGAIDFTPVSGNKRAGRVLAGLLTLAVLIKLIAWFLAGLILVKYRKSDLNSLAQNIQENPWQNLGLGLAGLILIPIAAILLLAVLVGYYIAGFLALWYLLLLMLSGIVGVVFFGAWIRNH